MFIVTEYAALNHNSAVAQNYSLNLIHAVAGFTILASIYASRYLVG